MQESQTDISEECQSLRRQNQLLERLLLGKGQHDYTRRQAHTDSFLGVNVQSELQARGMLRSVGSSRSNTRSQDNARMMQQAPINQHHQVRKAPASLAPKMETHSSIEQPLSSPHTGATSSSTTHAVSPDSSMIISPRKYQHSSFHNSVYTLQQQLSPHVSPHSDSQAQFPGYASQQFNRASFDYSQMPYNQHQSTASTPDNTSPNIGQSSSSLDYPQQMIHNRNIYSGKLSPFFTLPPSSGALFVLG